MGVDTKGKLKGKVLPEDVLNFIRYKYDKDATSSVEFRDIGSNSDVDWIKDRYDDSKRRYEWCGFIHFNDNGVNRSLFYLYQNTNSHENIELYSKYGLEDMVKSETTCITLSYFDNSVEIIKAIVTEFGGWIDENDCDRETFYPIEKDADGNIKPVFHVSMNDIYEKFGGIVIIDQK